MDATLMAFFTATTVLTLHPASIVLAADTGIEVGDERMDVSDEEEEE